MLKDVFLLISKLDGPPSLLMPPNAAENRSLPLKSYVFATLFVVQVTIFHIRTRSSHDWLHYQLRHWLLRHSIPCWLLLLSE